MEECDWFPELSLLVEAADLKWGHPTTEEVQLWYP